MRVSTLLSVASLLCMATARGIHTHRVHKRASAEHRGWARGPRADPDLVVPVQIDLAEPGIDDAGDYLLDVADPQSTSFGKFWSSDEITAAFSLPDEDIKSILSWIDDVTNDDQLEARLSPCRCRVDFNASITQLEGLLKAEYYVWTHQETGETSLACQHYSVPEHLLDSIDFILPTVVPFYVPDGVHEISELQSIGLEARDRSKLESRQLKVDCNRYTTPQCLREWYNIPPRPSDYAVHDNNTFGIFQPGWSSWLPRDMDHFFGTFEPEMTGERPIMQLINGGYYDNETENMFFNLEANLDFQYAMSLTWPQPVINIQVGDMWRSGNPNHMLAAFDEFYCDSLDSAIDAEYPDPAFPDGYPKQDCGTHEAPKVISISYAWDEGSFPPDYLRRQCQEYLKLGLQGITVLAGSGDEGTIGRTDACPETDDPSRRFHVSFPASCPWVTSVGGTMKVAEPGQTAKTKEAVYTHSFDSGANSSSTGGFSDVFKVPKYQKRETESYLDAESERLTSLNATCLFKRHGRGVPDLSALATEYIVGIHGQFRPVYGTSASTPVVASMIAMINNERMLKGKSPVGFINPVLYRHPEVFTDVEIGENVGCQHGFRAISGWDAATGLGSPDYKRLLNLFMSL